MDDNNNSTFQGHPFYLPLTMFNVAARTPFAIAAAFWRPWFTEPGKRKAPTRKQSEVSTEDVLQPQPEKKRAPATPKSEPEVFHHTKRKTPTPVPKKVALEKRPKRPTKPTLTEKLRLEQEERAQKTERLRKLRLAKEAAEKRKKPRSNGHAGARSAAKK